MKYINNLESIIAKMANKNFYQITNPILNTKLNGINKGDYLLVAGVPGSGKRSFVDNYFFIDILRQWAKIPEIDKAKEPLKIIYFSTKYKRNYKFLKWGCSLYFSTSSTVVDIATITGTAGKIFKMSDAQYEEYIKASNLIDIAFKKGVVEFEDTNVTATTLDMKLNNLAESMGSIEYVGGEAVLKYNEEDENTTVIVIVDDINNVKSGSSHDTGMAPQGEVKKEVDRILKKYSKMGFTVIGINTSAYNNYKKYEPSILEMTGFSPNKCVIMFNPLQEKLRQHVGFNTLEYVDEDDGINRLRFAYIAYNESGVSNYHIPLLFIPENGKFVSLNIISEEADEVANEGKFKKVINIKQKWKKKKKLK